MPPLPSFSLLSELESCCIGWMVNNQRNPSGLIKRGFKTERTLSFPRVNLYGKKTQEKPVLQPSQLK